MNQLIDMLMKARRCGCPLVAINTPDPAATIDMIRNRINGDPIPVLGWDIARAMYGLNQPGAATLAGLTSDPMMDTVNPVEALNLAAQVPDDTIVIFHNAHKLLESDGCVQAIWNLRDIYKGKGATLILLAPSWQLPVEIAQDVLVLDDPLPDAEQLAAIVGSIYDSADMPVPATAVLEKAVDATLGLSAFSAEQALALSLKRDGLDMGQVWERKARTVEQNEGVKIWRGGETFDSLMGYRAAVSFGESVITGREPPRCIVLWDEIEKSVGTTQDTSGVSQSMMGTILTYMNDSDTTGMIAMGPPGSGKSHFAKAFGGSAGVPTVQFDFTAMKGSLVGESERKLRQALSVVDAIGQGRAYFVATCNGMASLPPELRRRFTDGIHYFDLPTAEERFDIWSLYISQYELQDEVKQTGMPSDEGWTGAEIRNCCRLAYRLRWSLPEAATKIVPVSLSARDQIEKLRQEASGRYLSASHPGVYQYEKNAAVSGRKLEV